MEIVRGQIVTSRRGRDVTHVYVVLKAEAERVWLCDGKKRTLAAPKAKNPRHLQPTNTLLPEAELGTDLKIKGALKAYCIKSAPGAQGGL